MMKTVETAMEKTDVSTKPQVSKKHRGLKAMPYIIGNEAFEKLGTVGTSSNLMVYLTTVFNMKRISAALLINIWTGTANLATLVGAFLSDAYFGRYKTLGFSCVASFLGMVLMMLTAAVPQLHPPNCGTGEATACAGPTPWQLAFLYCALGFLVVGAGGIRPCCLAFGVDQFDPTTESGKRGINSFFNWYYFTFTTAIMISVTVIIYVQDTVSWALGFGIPTILMLLSCVVFFVGTRIYIKVMPEGGPFLSIMQVISAAIKKRGLTQPLEPQHSLFNPIHTNSLNSKLPYTDQLRFLDKAAIITKGDVLNANGLPSNPWRLCSVQQVEELKCLIRVIPIWVSGVFYYIANAQLSTYVVVQALQCDRRLGSSGFKIPAATFIVFSMVPLTIWIPIYDRIIIPFLRKLTGREDGITLLQRMGIGLFIGIIGMLISGVVEERRRSTALHHPLPGTVDSQGGAVSSMSALWLVPQLVLSGLSEAFNMVGHLEFYYKQFPENMRSVGGSLFFLSIAGTNYLNSLLVEVVHKTTEVKNSWLPEDLNKGRLENFYYLIAGIEVVNFVLFLVCAKWYRYKGNGLQLDAPSAATAHV